MNITTFCWIFYREQERTLEFHFCGGINPENPIQFSRASVNLQEILNKCDFYWNFVDQKIKNGKIFEDELEHLRFIERIQALGQNILGLICSDEIKNFLWSRAQTSSVIYIITSLQYIPWEALYYGDQKNGTFLGEQCMIVRKSDISRNTLYHNNNQISTKKRDRIIIMDKVLYENKNFMIGETYFSKKFEDDGEKLQTPITKIHLFNTVKEYKIIHWICEHTDEGLRIDDHEFYCNDDVRTYTFDQDQMIILSACRAGRPSNIKELPCIASEIRDYSGCTVLASSSNLAIRMSYIFTVEVNKTLSTEGLKLIDIWKQIMRPIYERKRKDKSLNICETLLLFFCVYGNPDLEVT